LGVGGDWSDPRRCFVFYFQIDRSVKMVCIEFVEEESRLLIEKAYMPAVPENGDEVRFDQGDTIWVVCGMESGHRRKWVFDESPEWSFDESLSRSRWVLQISLRRRSEGRQTIGA
jgi:hypothetical protein